MNASRKASDRNKRVAKGRFAFAGAAPGIASAVFAAALILLVAGVGDVAQGVDKPTPGLETVWLVGKMNGGYNEFTGLPARRAMDTYAQKYSGGFDIAAGKKLPKDAFPGLQAGPADSWSGHKAYPVRIHFTLDSVAPGGYALTVALAGVSPAGVSRMAVEIGGGKQSGEAAPGKNDDVLNTPLVSEPRTLNFFIPASRLRAGENVLTIRVDRGPWVVYDYVHFEAVTDASRPMMKDFSVTAPPFLAREAKGKLVHKLRSRCFLLGESATAMVTVKMDDGEIRKSVKLSSGDNRFDISVPERKTATDIRAKIELSGAVMGEASARIEPVRHITMTLLPHSHLDIGYPDLQPNIILDQRQYLEHALDVIESSKGAMTWVAEAAWPEWLLLNNRGPFEEYGEQLSKTELTKGMPESFWKSFNETRNVAATAGVRSSASDEDGLNNRRLVDGSPIGWQAHGMARDAWVELIFPKPVRIAQAAIRTGREIEDNPMRSGTLTLTDAKGRVTKKKIGATGAHRERLLVKLDGAALKSIRLDVDHAANDSKSLAFMEFETWEKAPASATVERMRRAVKSGRFEMTGLYMNFLTQLTPTEWLIRSMARANETARLAGAEPKVAWITDVPGFSFAMPDVLSGSGIRYFYPALNPDHAHTCLEGMPRAFLWRGPGGGEILVFHSFVSYMEGYNFGFTRDADLVEQTLPSFLADLDTEKYPYDMLPLRTLGDITDDGPVAEFLPRVVAEWNKRWAYPKVVIGTSGKFFADFDRKYAKSLPTLKGDWTSFWEDGEGSTAYETTIVRTLHNDLSFYGAFAAAQKLFGPLPKPFVNLLDRAEEDLYLYDEHTWGADMSVSSPDNLQTIGQWDFKQSPILEAEKLLPKMPQYLAPIARRFAPKATRGGRILAVMNDSGQARSSYVRVPIGESTPVRVFNVERVSEVASVISADSKAVTFMAEDVPGFGIRYYEVVEDTNRKRQDAQARPAQAATLENKFYKITIDEKTGRVVGIQDREAGKEVVDSADGFGMNEFLYVQGHAGSEPTRLQNVRIEPGESNSIYSEAIISGDAPRFQTIIQTVRLYHSIKRIEFDNFFDKEATLDKEGVYLAFPMLVPGGEVRLDMTGGVMALEKDQLSGASRDWISIQDAAAAVSENFSVAVAIPDAPLVVPERPRVLLFQKKLERKNNAIFSYVMNNYWHTNYKASQGGQFWFRYALTSAAKRFKDSDIIRFGRDVASQPKAFVVASPEGSKSRKPVSFLSVEPANVRLLGVKTGRDGRGIVVRLQEMDGKRGRVRLRVSPALPVKSAATTNLVERNAKSVAVRRDGADKIIDAEIGSRGLLTLVLK